jgi:RNA methyltransferase, TrmH family
MVPERSARTTNAAPARPSHAADAGPRLDSPADLIRSRDNKWVKSFRAALRGGGPESGDPIGVEGPKLVQEGFRAGLEAEAVLVSETGERELEHVLQAARESEMGVPRSRILRTTDKLFAGVAGTGTPQGIAALFRQPQWTLESTLHGVASAEGAFRGDAPLLVVLVGVQDPGNVGTIVRSAEAFDATGVIATRGTADPWSPKAVRASAGSALRLPLLRGLAVPITLAQLRLAEVQIYAATSRVDRDYPRGLRDMRLPCDRQPAKRAGAPADLTRPAAIVIGSEGHGLPPEVEHAADATISIPISETVESLNAAIAASLVLYEAARQRRIQG